MDYGAVGHGCGMGECVVFLFGGGGRGGGGHALTTDVGTQRAAGGFLYIPGRFAVDSGDPRKRNGTAVDGVGLYDTGRHARSWIESLLGGFVRGESFTSPLSVPMRVRNGDGSGDG